MTISSLSGYCIPIRSYAFVDMGFEGAAYYHPKIDHLIYDLSSDFTNGTYLLTSSAEAAKKMESPPCISSMRLPYATPLEDLIRIHVERLTAARQENPCLELVVRATPEEVIARERCMNRAKYEHRSPKGWVSEQEVEKLCSPEVKWAAKHIYAEIQKILKEEANAPARDENQGDCVLKDLCSKLSRVFRRGKPV